MKKAGFWMRVSALCIDEVILVALTWLLWAVAVKQLVPETIAHSVWFVVLFYELLDYNYYTLFWLFGGQTPGKRLLKTKLVKIDGTRFTYRDAFIRYWVWMFGVSLAGIGYFWIAWHPEKRGWNDLVAKTQVIRLG